MNLKESRTIGHYRVEERLGHGGMGAVYRAFNTRERRYVALKLILENLAEDPERRERFRREAKLLRQIDNSHIVPINEFGEIDGRLYLDMELIQGEDLGKVLARGPLEPTRAVAVVEQVAKALDAVHAKQLVHRDVKPTNIVLTKAGGAEHAYLVDFGIAKSTVDPTTLTAAGILVGTYNYLAPEILGGHTATARSDVYALGCVLFECLTGMQQFSGPNHAAIAYAHFYTNPKPPSAYVPELPKTLDDVVLRALAKDPAKRTTSASSLATGARGAITVRRLHTRIGMPDWDQPEPIANPPLSANPVPMRAVPNLPPTLADNPAPRTPPGRRSTPVTETHPPRPEQVGPVNEPMTYQRSRTTRPTPPRILAPAVPDQEPMPRHATRLGMPSDSRDIPAGPPRISASVKEKRFLAVFTAVALLLATGLVALALMLWVGVSTGW